MNEIIKIMDEGGPLMFYILLCCFLMWYIFFRCLFSDPPREKNFEVFISKQFPEKPGTIGEIMEGIRILRGNSAQAEPAKRQVESYPFPKRFSEEIGPLSPPLRAKTGYRLCSGTGCPPFLASWEP